jgi:predicted ATPase/DNA-binding SARP family transcriptional activator/DNA-binding CsgD family transcriptional regulator
MKETVRIRLLGEFRVLVGTRTIEEGGWRLRKAASLVKLLALSPGHRIHREQVMDRLWLNHGRRTAANNLRQALHVARRALDPDPSTGSRCLALQGEQLALCPEGQLWVDVEAFEEGVTEARRAKEPAAYRAALDLYTGELLPGDLYEEWAEERRRDLRGTYLTLLLELAALYEGREELGPAIEVLKRVIAKDQAHEEAHAGLMRLYALSGRQGEALAQYERLRELLSRELGTEPGADASHLYEEIQSGQFPSSHPSREKEHSEGEPLDEGKHNLPASRTSFVGREREMLEIKREVAMTRLLTLTGAGGSGKTRLALEVAKDVIGAYPDGVWLVELAGLSEPALAPQAVASAVGVQEQPDRSLTDTLVGALRKKKMLLVLDNCEHLVDTAARLVDTLLDSCPRLRVLATSREALGLDGEVIRTVTSLSLPDPQEQLTVEKLEGYESARLFVERALYRSPDFALTPENAPTVAEICWRLEGIPLAIELAATWVGTLSVEQIAERLKDALKLLRGGSRTAVSRQQTLRGTMDWSYELLSEPEQKLFGRLSVFAGGLTLEAAEAVGSRGVVEEEDVLDLLLRLTDKSLVVAETGREGAARYRMLEPVRQYAREKLVASGEADAVRRQHTAFFLALVEEAEPELTGAGQGAWLERLEAEHDNLRAVLRWSLEDEPETALQFAGVLARFWEIRSNFLEGRGWLETALRQNGRAEAAIRAKALTEAGTFAWYQTDFEQATVFHREALALYWGLGDECSAAFSLMCLGAQELDQGNYELAAPIFEEALTLSRKVGDKRTSAFVLHNLGEVARHRGEYDQAIALGMDSLSLLRELEDNWMVAYQLSWLGMVVAYHSDDHKEAANFLREGLTLGRELRLENVGLAQCLEASAALAGTKAKGARAAKLYGAADALRDAIGAPLAPVDRSDYEHNLAAARSQLDEAAWETVWVEGQAMTIEEAVEFALFEEKPTAPSVSPVLEQEEAPAGRQPPDLTRREKEIAGLVTWGLTNRQIASKLMVSERTVDNHVANILKKLGLSSREQVAARMAEQPPGLH